MNLLPLNNGVAHQTADVDVTDLTSSDASLIKQALEEKLIIVIRNQDKCPWSFANLIESISDIANYSQMHWTTDGNMINNSSVVKPEDWNKDKSLYPVQRVTGMKKKNQFSGIFGQGILDWHANLNGLDRADGVALQGWEGCEGTSTSFLNTNLAYNDLPEDLKQQIENVYCEYEYTPQKWAAGLPKEQLEYMMKGSKYYKMWLLQENIRGVKGVYFYTNNSCKIITEDNSLYERLYTHVFQEKYIYQHWWKPGDIILMDQLLTLHKRDQDDPEILSKRVLNRITFYISNHKGWIKQRNQI